MPYFVKRDKCVLLHSPSDRVGSLLDHLWISFRSLLPPHLTIFGTPSDHYWGPLRNILGSPSDRCWVPFGLYLDLVSIIVGSPSDHTWIPFGSLVGPFGHPSDCIWISFRSMLGPLPDHIWISFRSFRVPFGPYLDILQINLPPPPIRATSGFCGCAGVIAYIAYHCYKGHTFFTCHVCCHLISSMGVFASPLYCPKKNECWDMQ